MPARERDFRHQRGRGTLFVADGSERWRADEICFDMRPQRTHRPRVPRTESGPEVARGFVVEKRSAVNWTANLEQLWRAERTQRERLERHRRPDGQQPKTDRSLSRDRHPILRLNGVRIEEPLVLIVEAEKHDAVQRPFPFLARRVRALARRALFLRDDGSSCEE